MKQLAFLHIPKTGGRTIINLCKQFYKEQDCATVQDLRQPYQMKVAFAEGHFPYDILQPNYNRLIFTLLRDPAKRVLSYYQMTLRYSPERWVQYPLFWKDETPMPILDFANDKILHSGMIRNGMVRQLVGRELFLQKKAVEPHHVEIAIKNLQSLMVGFVSDYDKFVKSLCHVMGWQKPSVYPLLNQSQPYQTEKHILDDLREINQYDVMLYQWAKENLSA